MELSTRLKASLCLFSLGIYGCTNQAKPTEILPSTSSPLLQETPEILIPNIPMLEIPTDIPEAPSPQIPNCSNVIIDPINWNYDKEYIPNAPLVDAIYDLNLAYQSSSNSGFVKSKENTITQFRQAQEYGTIVFIAHDYMAGTNFYKLHKNDTFTITVKGQDVKYFVTDTFCFKTKSPTNPESEQVQINNNAEEIGKTMPASDLFRALFIQKKENWKDENHPVVFMTCIPDPNIPFDTSNPTALSWGRFFVTAKPIK